MVRIHIKLKDDTPIILREPCPTDAVKSLKYFNKIIEEPMSGLLMDKQVTLREEKTWVKNTLKTIKKRKLIFLFATKGDQIVGSCSIDRRAYKHSHRAVFGIAISRDWRRKGLGENISKTAINLARKRMKGLKLIELDTFGYNKRAHALYWKLGFVNIAKIPYGTKENGKYYDELLMHLYLK